MQTNLKQSNSYYEVTQGFTLQVLTGHRPSNEWAGAAQIHRATYTPVEVKKGDRIANLHGGLFYVLKSGLASPCVMTIDTASFFERSSAPRQIFPLDKLRETAQFKVRVRQDVRA